MASTWGRPEDITITIGGAHQFQPGMTIELDRGDGRKMRCRVTKVIDRCTLQLAEMKNASPAVPDAMIRPSAKHLGKFARTDPIRRDDAPYKDIE